MTDTAKNEGSGPDPDHYEALIQTLRRKQVAADIRRDAARVGIRPDALEDVIQRALTLFDFTSSGGLAGPDGLTTIGWMRYPLRQEAAHLFRDDAVHSNVGQSNGQTSPKETPRQKLARANGEGPLKWN